MTNVGACGEHLKGCQDLRAAWNPTEGNDPPEGTSVSTAPRPEGITDPPIDSLLDKTDSKYSLVIVGAKRARQINAYYSQLGEGLLEYVGPLVETHVQEKPLSIALREIDGDLLKVEKVDPAEETES